MGSIIYVEIAQVDAYKVSLVCPCPLCFRIAFTPRFFDIAIMILSIQCMLHAKDGRWLAYIQ